jgi:hypothetical protein
MMTVQTNEGEVQVCFVYITTNLGIIASDTRTTTLSPATTCKYNVNERLNYKFKLFTEVLLSRCCGKTTSHAIMTR